MQIVNDTDETITLEPREALTIWRATEHQFEGDTYRIEIESIREMGVDPLDLDGPWDFIDRGWELAEELRESAADLDGGEET